MKFLVYTDNDNMHIHALTNYVPAVAVIRKRLVLFILIRYKGYLDGSKYLFKENITTRVLCEESRTYGVKIKFFDTSGTDKGEGNLLCKN